MTVISSPTTLSILPDAPPPPGPIGLIAGGGRLPILVAMGLKEQGYRVHAVGFHHQYDAELGGHCDTLRDVGLLRVGTWGRSLASQGCRHAIMVGKVDKARIMHDPWRVLRHVPDWTTIRMWYRSLRHDRRSHAVLKSIAHELDQAGIALLDSTMPIPTELSSPGVMTRCQPTRDQRADIDFVWPMLVELLRLDIGQALAVRERDVIAVEAVEGTDKMIERVGQLCRSKGWTLCKGSRVGHDRRSDVPTVGVTTLWNMHANGGTCLALAAGDVIMLDKDEMIELADRLNIAIVGVPTAHGPRVGA